MTAHRMPTGHRLARPGWRRTIDWFVPWVVVSLNLLGGRATAHAQVTAGQEIIMGGTVVAIDVAVGRSIPMSSLVSIERVSVANPEIADVVIVAEQELVVNALSSGVTDLIIWRTDGRRFHYRVTVHSATDRRQVLLQVRLAEASRDFLREIGVSFLWSDRQSRVGTGEFATQGPIDEEGRLSIPGGPFATLLSIDDLENLTGLLDLAEQTGRFRLLAEPNLIAANREEAAFLVGGEIPIPVSQPAAAGGVATVTIQFREFGIQLAFVPEILSDSLIKLQIEPEVSSLDFGNGVLLSGFRVPAFRTRRASTTVDMQPGQTLAIAGLLSSERQKVNTGVPLLKDIPILGLLFSSQRWQRNETELLVLVTPRIIDPMSPPAAPPALPGERD